MPKYCFILSLMFALYPAEATAETDEEWPSQFVELATWPEIQSLPPFSDHFEEYRKQALNLQGEQKLYALTFVTLTERARTDTRFGEDFERLKREVEAQDSAIFRFYVGLIERSVAPYSVDQLVSDEKYLLRAIEQEDLEPRQRVLAASHLIDVYLGLDKEHLFPALLEKIKPLAASLGAAHSLEKSWFYESAAFAYSSLRDSVSAYEAYNAFFSSALPSGYPVPLDSLFHNITVLLMEAKHFENAQSVNRVARDIAEESSDKAAIFSPALVCAGIANRIESYREAADCIQDAEPYLERWPMIAATFKSQAAIAFVNLGETARARTYFDSLTEDDLLFMSQRVVRSVKEVEALIAHNEGDYAKAFDTYREYTRDLEEYLDDQLDRATKDLRASSIEEKAALTQLNTALENQAMLQAENITRVRTYLGIVVFIALVAFALSWLLWRQMRASQRLLETLESTNGKLADSLKDRELLLQEIHHRVKNNLQLVVSLLNLQGRRLGDQAGEQKARRVIHEVQSRVHTMSLIHKELYRARDFDALNVGALVRDLASYVVSLSEEETELELSIEDMMLDVDSAMPAGLIACEVLSNSLEHGRSPETAAKIRVVLEKQDAYMSLKISDNGPGIHDAQQPDELESLGMLLIRDLADQIDGTFKMYNCPDYSGACFDFLIPLRQPS